MGSYIGLGNTIDLTKNLNLEKVYKLILINQPISRAKISQILNLNKVTVSSCVDFLLDKGIVEELGITEAERGRPPTQIGINGNAGVFIGIEIAVLSNKVLVTDLSGKELEKCTLPDTGNDPHALVELIETTVNEFIKKYQSRKLGVLGVGIAVPGFYNHHTGVIEFFANRQTWNGFPIRKLLEKYCPGTPFYIQSSGFAGAMGEIYFGSSDPAEHLAYIFGTWGLSVSIYSNGTPHTGYLGITSRFGHTIVEVDGRECICGNRGCLEAYASVRSLFEKLYPGKPFHYSYFEEILDQLKHSNPIVVEAMSELSRYLAIGIVNIVNAYTPSQVCIGGYLGLLIGSTPFLGQIKSEVNKALPEHLKKDLDVYCSELGELSVAYGCISIVRDHLIGIIIDAD